MTFSPKRLLAFASLSSLFLLASCGKFFVDENGSSTGTTCTTNCIYIGNYDSSGSESDVAAFAAVNPLTVVSSTNVSLGDNPTSMVVNPANTYLFSASSDTGAIFAFAIQSGGTLGGVTTALSATEIPIRAITVDPSGNYLLAAEEVTEPTTTCASGIATAVQVFSGVATGTLTAVGTTSTNLPCGTPTSIAVSPNGDYIFVGLGTGGLEEYQYDASTGAITEPASATVAGITGTNFNGVAVDSQSKYLFASASGTAGGAYAFTIGATSLTPAGSVQNSGQSLYPIVVDASNTYVYAADSNNGEVYGYTFGTSGLTGISGSPFSPSATSSGTLGMVTNGSFVITANSTSGPNIQEFKIGSGGALTASSTGTTGSASGYEPLTIATTH
jgi:6-phosphogluconolactonase (cycloisomerase 2 family)